MLLRLVPALFVLLWSTGFIGTKMGASGAEPFTFLTLRFVLVLALLIPLGWWMGARPLTVTERRHAVIVGLLVHASYLAGVMWALRHGMTASVAALVVCLQPILTAILAGLALREVITKRHWLGLALGLLGTALVIAPKFAGSGLETAAAGITIPTLAAVIFALFGITCGTIYQKRYASSLDLVSGAIWQYAGSLAVIAPLSLLFETRHVDWTPGVIGALVWLVVVLSIGAMSLLMLMIREHAVSRTSGLFYLVPGVTAVLAYAIFDEQLAAIQIAGLLVVTIAVLLMQVKKSA